MSVPMLKATTSTVIPDVSKGADPGHSRWSMVAHTQV